MDLDCALGLDRDFCTLLIVLNVNHVIVGFNGGNGATIWPELKTQYVKRALGKLELAAGTMKQIVPQLRIMLHSRAQFSDRRRMLGLKIIVSPCRIVHQALHGHFDHPD